MQPITISELDESGLNAPVTHFPTLHKGEFDGRLGASRYRYTYPTGEHLDALLVNKGADILVVTFHGALNRSRFSIPRFERLRSTSSLDVSALYIADPTLWLSDSLQLGWYVGPNGHDAQSSSADWALRAAAAVGATRIVFTGSSGGGFAALQVSALVKGSLALPFNPQTSIGSYLIDGERGAVGAQRTFIEVVHPELAPEGTWALDFSKDWSSALGDRASVVRRYAGGMKNFVLFAVNINDSHHHLDHYLPLEAVIRANYADSRLRKYTYEGARSHTPPSPTEFTSAMNIALAWAAELPPIL